MLIKGILEWMGFKVMWRAFTDSSAARSMSQRLGVGKVRHMDVRALWVQRAVRERGLRVLKVPGNANPADLLKRVRF